MSIFPSHKKKVINDIMGALDFDFKKKKGAFSMFISKNGDRKARKEIRESIAGAIFFLVKDLNKNGDSWFEMKDGNIFCASCKYIANQMQKSIYSIYRAIGRMKKKALLLVKKSIPIKNILGEIIGYKVSAKTLLRKLFVVLGIEKTYDDFLRKNKQEPKQTKNIQPKFFTASQVKRISVNERKNNFKKLKSIISTALLR